MEERFNFLYREYSESIKGYIDKRVNNREVAEDIMHDTFMKFYIFMKEGNYKEIGHSKSYLYTTAHNLTVNYFGSMHFRKITTAYDYGAHVAYQLSSYGNIHDELCNKEMISNVLRIICELPDWYHITFIMVHFDGFKYKEVAEQLGVPVGTIKSRLHHCDNFLRSKGFPFVKNKKTNKKKIRKETFRKKKLLQSIA